MELERALEIFDLYMIPPFPCPVTLDEWYESKDIIKQILQEYLNNIK